MTLAFRAALRSILRSFFVLALFGLTISAHKAGAKPRVQAAAEKRSWFPTHEQFLEMSQDEKYAFIKALREAFSTPVAPGETASVDAFWGGRLDAFNALFFPLSEAQGGAARRAGFQCEFGGVLSADPPNAETGRCPGVSTFPDVVTIPSSLRGGASPQTGDVRLACASDTERMCHPLLYGFVITHQPRTEGAATQRIVQPICFPENIGTASRPGMTNDPSTFNRECERFANGEWLPGVQNNQPIAQRLEGAALEAYRRSRLAAQAAFLAEPRNARLYSIYQRNVEEACSPGNLDRITNQTQKNNLASRCVAIKERLNGLNPDSPLSIEPCRMVSGLMRTSAMCYACALEARERTQPGRAAFEVNRRWMLSLAVGRQLCPGTTKPAMHEMIERFGYCEQTPEARRLENLTGEERELLDKIASGEISPSSLENSQKRMVAKGLGLTIEQLGSVLCAQPARPHLGGLVGSRPAFDRGAVRNALAALDGQSITGEDADRRRPVVAAWRACAAQAFQPEGQQSRFQENGCNANSTIASAPGGSDETSNQPSSYPAVFEPASNTGECHVILSPNAVRRDGAPATFQIARFSRQREGNRERVLDNIPNAWAGGTVRRVLCAFPSRPSAPPATPRNDDTVRN